MLLVLIAKGPRKGRKVFRKEKRHLKKNNHEKFYYSTPTPSPPAKPSIPSRSSMPLCQYHNEVSGLSILLINYFEFL